ncbi:endonuclease MutS2 [Bdellovibrio sp. qaytius]|nr:endonuclease MutS2 [Bdellovibrio sp. qaytius]
MLAIKNLDWSEILEKTAAYATSEQGKNLVLEIKPLESADAAEKSFYEIESGLGILSGGIRPHMESLDLFGTWITRVRKAAVLKPLELKDIRHFCLEVIALKEALKEQSSAWALDLNEKLMNAEEPLSAIDSLITPSCDIRMDASEKLYSLSKEKDSLGRQIQTKMDRLVKDHDIEHMLQERFVTTREGRWVIPVKGGMQHFVPGVVHAASQSKQTVYIEPEVIIPMNNRLRAVEVEIEEEIERLLIEISNYLATQKVGFEKTEKEMLLADVLLAKSQLTIHLGARPCKFNSDKLELRDLFHPLLKMTGRTVISNTVTLAPEKSILMLSGPNAGGKTVLLKSIGLAAQMARCGLPICADRASTLPFFKDICTGIGDSQSVDEDLSTFAAHLKTLDQALKLKGPENLILVDEICGSTDPEEGSALARSFIEAYAANGVIAVITSHLSPLKTGWKPEDVVINGSLEYDSKSGKPTYQFLPGIPGDSLALLTAKRVGVDPKIIAKATENLSPLAQKKLSQLEEIETLKKDIANLQDKLKKELKGVEQKRLSLESQIIQFERQKENELEKTIKKASAKVEDAISTAKAAAMLNKHRELQDIKYNLPEIVKGNQVAQTATIQNAQEFGKKFPPGSKVFVNSLNQDGIVQSLPNSKGEVMILSQSIRLQLHWQDLKPANKFSNPTNQLVQRSSLQVSFHDEDRVVDLRGKTVEAAVSELEFALDKASVNKEDRLKVVHGHGTETLKKAIRTYLSRSVYVKKWKAGNQDSGGDGITWVELGL